MFLRRSLASLFSNNLIEQIIDLEMQVIFLSFPVNLPDFFCRFIISSSTFCTNFRLPFFCFFVGGGGGAQCPFPPSPTTCFSERNKTVYDYVMHGRTAGTSDDACVICFAAALL